MSRFPEAAIAAAVAAAIAGTALAGPLGLGREATPEEVAAWDIDVRPDGTGLPVGSGDVFTGEEIFTEKCAVCHGDFGEGAGRWPVLAGGQGTLTRDRPIKTVGSYWPYLSTVWDYLHRAMPFGDAQSLSNDEVYAITAYILYLNDLVDDDFELSNENFTEVRLPNEENFFMDDREQSPVFTNRTACMENCKPEVKITARAAVLDVTPEGGGDDAGLEDGGSAETTAAASEATTAEPADAKLDADLIAAGEKVFKKCKACHQVGEGAKNRVGPMLNGIFGAQVAAVDDFSYSGALSEKGTEGVVWDAETLDAFLSKPKDWASGTKMSFAGLRKEEDRAAIIEFLKSHSR